GAAALAACPEADRPLRSEPAAAAPGTAAAAFSDVPAPAGPPGNSPSSADTFARAACHGPALAAPSCPVPPCSPLPCTRGRGGGGEGAAPGVRPTPSPQPLSPEYRGEGLPEDATLYTGEELPEGAPLTPGAKPFPGSG